MGKPDFIGEGGGHAAFALGEAGEDEQAFVGQGFIPIGWDALGQGAGGADDDGLRAAQEDLQTFLFHGREWKPLMTQRPASRHLAA